VASVGEWSRTIILLGSHSEQWSSRMVCLVGQSFFRSSQVVSSFEEWFVLEVGAGQSFPLGNGPDSHSLGKTHSIQVAL
jgi:hypothetical protein